MFGKDEIVAALMNSRGDIKAAAALVLASANGERTDPDVIRAEVDNFLHYLVATELMLNDKDLSKVAELTWIILSPMRRSTGIDSQNTLVLKLATIKAILQQELGSDEKKINNYIRELEIPFADQRKYYNILIRDIPRGRGPRPLHKQRHPGKAVESSSGRDELLETLVNIIKKVFPAKSARVLDANTQTVDRAKLREEADRFGIDYQGLSNYKLLNILFDYWNNEGLEGLPSTDDYPDLEFIEEVGSGTYGEVWRVRDEKTNVLYAAKLFHTDGFFDADDGIKELYDEALLLRWLNPIGSDIGPNPNVVSYIGMWQDYPMLGRDKKPIQVPLLLSEYIDGMNLLKVKSNVGAKDKFMDMNWMAEQLFNGIAHIHSLGVAHRDIKPNNIMLEGPSLDSDDNYRRGRIVIVDFGLSCVVDKTLTENRTSDKACTNEVEKGNGGTWIYQSPEVMNFYSVFRTMSGHQRIQFTTDMSIQYSSDIWACVLTLLEVLLPRDTFYETYIQPQANRLSAGEIATLEPEEIIMFELQTFITEGGSEKLIDIKENVDNDVKKLSKRIIRENDFYGIDVQRTKSIVSICNYLTSLLLSFERRRSAKQVFDLIYSSNKSAIVWFDGLGRVKPLPEKVRVHVRGKEDHEFEVSLNDDAAMVRQKKEDEMGFPLGRQPGKFALYLITEEGTVIPTDNSSMRGIVQRVGIRPRFFFQAAPAGGRRHPKAHYHDNGEITAISDDTVLRDGRYYG
jgi:serine/threonine protein kinase